MSIRCDVLDAAISRRVLEVIQPAELEIAIEAMKQLERQNEAVSRQRQMQIERAEYETELAQRRYEEVDPANRLVASTLERRWNDALVKVEELRARGVDASLQQKEPLKVAAGQRAKVLGLTRDFPRLWSDPSTSSKDKKRLLRLLIKDITVERFLEQKRIVLHVRWQGGACEDIETKPPPKAADRVRYPEGIVQRVRELAHAFGDAQIAETLEQEGRSPSKGKVFTVASIRWIRYKHRIHGPVLKRPTELTVREVAQQFGVSRGVVYYWIDRGVIEARRLNEGSPYWVTLTAEKTTILRRWVRNSSRIHGTKMSWSEIAPPK